MISGRAALSVPFPVSCHGGGKAAQGCAASPSQMGRFETQWLAIESNLCALTNLSGQWIDLVHRRRPPRGIVLDIVPAMSTAPAAGSAWDSSVSPTHGEQEDERLERSLPMRLRSPAVRVQPVRRFWNAVRCCSSRLFCDIAGRSHASISAPMPPSRCPRSASIWRLSGSNMRFDYRQPSSSE